MQFAFFSHTQIFHQSLNIIQILFIYLFWLHWDILKLDTYEDNT